MAVWVCSCGRRVPSAVYRCHCGLTRDVAPPAAAARPAGGGFPATARTGAPRGGRRWRLHAAIGLFLLVTLFWSVRSYRVGQVEEVARIAAFDMLGTRMNRGPAREAYARYHPSCFSEFCSGTWTPWRAPELDKESYVQCMVNKVRVAAGFAPLPMPKPRRRAEQVTTIVAGGTAAPTAGPVAVVTAAPTAVVTQAPTEAPVEGRLFLGDVKVLSFRREPQLTLRVQFMVLGTAALMPKALCSYAITCNGEAQGTLPGQRMVAPCVTVQGALATGLLEATLPAAAPRQGACQMDLTLTDSAETPRSDPAVVPLG